MINRIYVHNFRSFENFELSLGNGESILLVGKNGAGKSTVGMVLEVLQKIARGSNRVADLVGPKDITRGQHNVPVRFEIEVCLSGKIFKYSIVFEFPTDFRELRVLSETLSVDGAIVLSRELSQVRLSRTSVGAEANFRIDWHLVALPIIQENSSIDPISILRSWLAKMMIIRPTPSLISGYSEEETIHPKTNVSNIGEWFSGVVAHSPASYARMAAYLEEVMPDFVEVRNPIVSRNFRSLSLHFGTDSKQLDLSIEDISDGERCFLIFALTIAANAAYGPVLCFWDEPDNFLAPAEVGSSIMALRRAFQGNGQLVVTSHNVETIRRFSDENTLILQKNSHLEPTIKTTVAEMRNKKVFNGSFVEALIRGDIEI